MKEMNLKTLLSELCDNNLNLVTGNSIKGGESTTGDGWWHSDSGDATGASMWTVSGNGWSVSDLWES